MSRKAFYTVIAFLLAGIFVTFGIFLFQRDMTAGKVDAALIVKSRQSGFEFWEQLEKGAEEGAKEFGVDLKVDGALSEDDTEGQIAAVQRAIAEEPDVLILAAVDQDALLPYAKEAKEKGIKLILVDSGLREPVEDCFVKTDNYEAANYVGDVMGQEMGAGKVAIVSHARQTTTAQQRIAGFERALLNYPEIKIIPETVLSGAMKLRQSFCRKIPISRGYLRPTKFRRKAFRRRSRRRDAAVFTFMRLITLSHKMKRSKKEP